MKEKYIFLVLFIVAALTFPEINVQAQSSSKLAEFCSNSAGEDATYLKDFVIELDAAGADGKAQEAKFTMLLSKNTQYRFTVCNAEGSGGKAILQLHDVTKMYFSTYNQSSGQTLNSIDFQCQKTGAYHLIVSFIDGKKGSAVAIVSFVKTL